MEILVNLIEDDPQANNERLFKKWWDSVQKDDDLLTAIARHAFTNMISALERDRRKITIPRITGQQITAQRSAIAKLTETVRSVVLMDITLPNGKKLKQATFKECSLAGGWFKLLACKGKPSEKVGDVLTEADLHKIGKT